MLKRLFVAAGVLLFVVDASTRADLVGDSVDVRVMAPNQGDFDQTQTTVVAADASDALVFNLSPPIGVDLRIEVDPFGGGFVLTNIGSDTIVIGAGSLFEFSDLDWIGNPGEVQGVDVTENWDAINASTSFSTDSAAVNFINANSVVDPGQSMTVTLDVSHVPEPSAFLYGLISSIIACGVWAKRRSVSPIAAA